MLVKHLRDGSRRPFGTIVAIGPRRVGISICNYNEPFDKGLGVALAKYRAKNGMHPKMPNRYVYQENDECIGYRPIHVVLADEIASMMLRSTKYFKKENTNAS